MANAKQKKATQGAVQKLLAQRKATMMGNAQKKLSVPTSSVARTVGGTLQGAYGNPQDKAYGGSGTEGVQKQANVKLQGSFKKGGKVKKTGAYKLHKGEQVVPAKTASKVRKSGGFNAKKYESMRKSVFGLGKRK